VTPLETKSDERGTLVEFLHLDEIDLREGQVYCTVTKPGFVRANHYHRRKTEWFCVIGGEGKLVLRDRKSGRQQEILLGEKAGMKAVMIPPDCVHALKNVGRTRMYHVAYISERYREEDPDTYPEKIL
jgi:dTDP-4-dehydrorhamnose 3,5-epimerase-like enzyme